MKLRVFVICEECHRQVELVVDGEFDIAAVKHDCEALRAFEVTRSDSSQLKLAA